MATHPRGTLLANVVHTTVKEPHLFPLHKNDHITRLRNGWLARQAWNELMAARPDAAYSLDYEEGFKAGFADYLYAGGNGQPPVTPPRRYWNVDYDTPEGKQAICQWFDGFRHGAAVCCEGGFRQLAVVPSSACATPVQSVPQQLPHVPLESPELEIIQPAAEPTANVTASGSGARTGRAAVLPLAAPLDGVAAPNSARRPAAPATPTAALAVHAAPVRQPVIARPAITPSPAGLPRAAATASKTAATTPARARGNQRAKLRAAGAQFE